MKGYVEAAREQGADIVVGGEDATVAGLEGGFFLQPTVISGVRNDMTVAQEEIFGPVLSVIPGRTRRNCSPSPTGWTTGSRRASGRRT